MLEISMTNEQKVRVVSTPATAAGQPAAVEGALSAIVVSGDGTWEPDVENPLALFLISGAAPGDTAYIIQADADLGEGVVMIQDSAIIHVAGALAAALGLAAEAPVAK